MSYLLLIHTAPYPSQLSHKLDALHLIKLQKNLEKKQTADYSRPSVPWESLVLEYYSLCSLSILSTDRIFPFI